MKTRAVLAFAGSVFLPVLAFAQPDNGRLLFRERTSFLGQGTSMLPTRCCLADGRNTGPIITADAPDAAAKRACTKTFIP